MQPTFSRLTLTLLLALSLPGLALAQAGGASAKVATVNGVAIPKSRVDAVVRAQVAQGQKDTPELRAAIRDRLILLEVVAQEAGNKGLAKTADTRSQIELANTNILAQAFRVDFLKRHPISDDALKAEFEKIKKQMGDKEYKARHILVEKESDAKDIISRLNKNPKAFETLAKEKSKDPGSKVKGGDLGWFDPRGMVPEFGAAVAKLEKGKFTEKPVKSQFGYHVILLEDSRPLPVQALEEVKPALTRHLQEQKLKKFFDEIKAKAKIEITQTSVPAPAAMLAPAVAPAQETKQ